MRDLPKDADPNPNAEAELDVPVEGPIPNTNDDSVVPVAEVVSDPKPC